MTGPVVDASVALFGVFEDENRLRADTTLEQLADGGALVPPLQHLETRNALMMAERRGRLDALKKLPITTDQEPELQLAFDLARVHALTMYDALYLELAMRRNTALATLDRRLGQAAESEGIPLLGA